MHSPLSKTAAVLAVALPLARAFDHIHFPSTVTAGKPTTLTITNDLASGADSFDAGFDSFRVYLATTPPGWGTGPVCQLVNSSAIDTTTLSITIPADVGPSGAFYSIAVMEFNQDPNKDGPSGFEYSGDFSLVGGTAEWSAAELAGTGFGDGDLIPCTAYNCVRQCTVGVDIDAAQEDMDLAKQMYECMYKCPGVNVPSWDEITSEMDNNEYGDTEFNGSSATPAGSSTAVSASSAPSRTALATTKAPATASAKATPSSTLSQAPSASISQSPSPTSNSTVPVVSPNAGSQIAAGIPMLFSLFAGVLLM